MTWFAGLAQGAAGQAVSGGITMGLQRLGANYDTRIMAERQRQAMGIQMEGEKEMLDYQKMKDLETLEGSYGAQMAGMEKNGLNPALMYGTSGGGGSTGGGAPAVGMARENPEAGKTSAGMQILTSAQLKLMDAQANAANAQAQATIAGIPNIGKQGNVLDWTAKDIAQGIENKVAAKALIEAQTDTVAIANKINRESANDQIQMIGEQLNEQINKVKSAMAQANVDEATQDEKIKQLQNEVIAQVLRNILTEAQTKNVNAGTANTQENTKKTAQDIVNSIRSLNLTEGGQRIEMRKAEITRLLGERGLDIAQQGIILGVIDKVMGVITSATK